MNEEKKIKEDYDTKLNAANKSGDYKEFYRLLSELSSRYDKGEAQIEAAKKEKEDFIKKADQFKKSFSDYEIYRRLGGETEARNVQNRLMMDLVQRQQNMPTQTQEYPYEGQLSVRER